VISELLEPHLQAIPPKLKRVRTQTEPSEQANALQVELLMGNHHVDELDQIEQMDRMPGLTTREFLIPRNSSTSSHLNQKAIENEAKRGDEMRREMSSRAERSEIGSNGNTEHNTPQTVISVKSPKNKSLSTKNCLVNSEKLAQEVMHVVQTTMIENKHRNRTESGSDVTNNSENFPNSNNTTGWFPKMSDLGVKMPNLG